MFQQSLFEYYRTLAESIQAHFSRAAAYRDPDALHEMRVGIKQLRAYFRVIECLAPATFPAKKYLRPIRKLFKVSGDVRDAQVQQELTRAWAKEMGVFLSEYYNELKRKELRSGAAFTAFAAHFDLENELHHNGERMIRALAPLTEENAAQSVRDRLDAQLQELHAYEQRDLLQENCLHPLRILAKETRYTLDIATRCFPEIAYGEGLDAMLRGIYQALGHWHDGDVAKEHLNEFHETYADTSAFTDEHAYDVLFLRIRDEKETYFREFQARWAEFSASPHSVNDAAPTLPGF